MTPMSRTASEHKVESQRAHKQRRAVRPAGQMLDALSPREWDVLKLIVRGKTDRQIADELFLSRITVSNHVSHILCKLEVPNRTAAASIALASMYNRDTHQTSIDE